MIEPSPAPQIEPATVPEESPSLVQSAPVASAEPAPYTVPVAAEPAPYSVPAPVEPEPRVEEAPAALVASAPEVVREEPQSPAPVSEAESVVQPGRADPASILASLKSGASDLVQIETDPHKVQAMVEEEEAPRLPRVRRPRPVISNEPLMQVETRRREAAEEALPQA